jgi:hypothetical protein
MMFHVNAGKFLLRDLADFGWIRTFEWNMLHGAGLIAD